MNILIQLSHPAHFHLYKLTAKQLMEDGHKVFILIKTKDILEDLLKASGLPYFNILPQAHRNSRLGILWDMLVRDWRILLFVWKNRIDLLTGSTPEVAQVGWLTRKLRINTGEDDMDIVPLFAKLAGPFIQTILSPDVCKNFSLEKKSVKYASYHELAYLHPNHFTPDARVVEKYFSAQAPFFIIRFAQLKAHHDHGINGINTEIARKLLEILKPHGRFFIPPERPLDPEFEPYRIHINPIDMHHIMAFAELYIGDSQTMAAEAGVLGVPFIRFNDFVGRIGIFKDLEDNYRLGYGIRTDQKDLLYKTVEDVLSLPNRKAVFNKRRQKMLSEKIDYSCFLTWFIENYPDSVQTMNDNPEFQRQFR